MAELQEATGTSGGIGVGGDAFEIETIPTLKEKVLNLQPPYHFQTQFPQYLFYRAYILHPMTDFTPNFFPPRVVEQILICSFVSPDLLSNILKCPHCIPLIASCWQIHKLERELRVAQSGAGSGSTGAASHSIEEMVQKIAFLQVTGAAVNISFYQTVAI